ncbi:MAG: hypothetical protein J5773_03600, partial [Verrucomicrobia bacterium]|nr:hypothetical protein [Verrucomicrobiota bacterium]
MKKFYILIVLSLIIAGVAAAAVWHIRGSNEKTLAQQKEQWDNEKLELQAQLDGIAAQMEELKTQKNELNSPELDPAALIARLREMKDMAADSEKTDIELPDEFVNNVFGGGTTQTNEAILRQGHDQVREAFFVFQGLRDQGNRSLEAIGEYLTSGDNVTLYRDANGRRIRFRRDQSSVIPMTSRLGLIRTLGEIKTSDALELLCQTMQNSSDLREILSAGNILLAENKEAYTKAVLAACMAILPNLKNNEQSELLAFIKDLSEEDYKTLLANLNLYNEYGHLSMDIFRRKMETLGEAALPEAIDAFNREGALLAEKLVILESMKKFIGSNEQATALFTGYINGLEGDDKDMIGSMAILIGASELESAENKSEKQQQYLNVLSQLNAPENDQSLFGETLVMANDFLNQQIQQGDNFNEDEYMKNVLSSGYIQRMMSSSM